ncbi:uroporphyrinogen-III C-methyltransferase [Salinicola rhizosphaerae]|uniref:Uroporphyrin-3 C-methyltransferase n=1 Tax=Salinicola rhizosphaerae TaxID=1443141 RepID=A0ABQ3DQR7_9GAMM|nr:uroporphyrinogen-III C-methyltransferase [Salinicola rhizosphaerae]GHB12287.1 hypothetical protein GCM10009038_07550 [Salinicola rhizosphaerae]
MSKQRKDQQPQSAADAGTSGAGDDSSRATSSPAASSAKSSEGDSQKSPTPGNTDPIKPDVTQPAGSSEPDAKSNSAKPVTSDSGDAGAKTPSADQRGNAGAGKKETAGVKASGGTSGASRSGNEKKSGSRDGKPSAAATTVTANASSSTAGSSRSDKGAGTSSPGGGGAAGSGGSGGSSGSSGRGGSSGKGGKLGLLALLLVIVLAILCAIGGYWGWQKLQRQQAQLDQVNANRASLNDLESRVGDLDQDRQQSLKMMRGEFDQYRQNLDKTLDKVLKELAQQQQADPREWLHAEAEYLLRLANQRLQLERDVKGAKALLNAADDRLREADNPALVPVRRAIQSELAALDSVPEVDRTGIYLALMAQQEQLAKLPLKQDIEQIAAGKGDAKPTGGWREQLATLGSELKDLVTVRRHDQPLEALITPEQESYLRQNVRLLLEQAQLAVLKAEPKLYQASLDKARELIQGYYAPDSDGVKNALDKLQSLRDQSIRPELPDISESSQVLKRFIEQRFGGSGDGNRGQGSQGGSAQGEGA